MCRDVERGAMVDRHAPQRLDRLLAQRQVGVAAHRITSYNVCYTKLLRSLPVTPGFINYLEIDVNQVTIAMKGKYLFIKHAVGCLPG